MMTQKVIKNWQWVIDELAFLKEAPAALSLLPEPERREAVEKTGHWQAIRAPHSPKRRKRFGVEKPSRWR
jgi:hypothetical protein